MNEKINFIFTYPSFKMIGLSNEIIDGLARWYSFFAERRSLTYLSEDMFLAGSAVVDEKSRKMGMRIFTSVIATQEKMDDVVSIQFLGTFFDRLYFRCQNALGEDMLILLTLGGMIEGIPNISIFKEYEWKSAYFSFGKYQLKVYDTYMLDMSKGLEYYVDDFILDHDRILIMKKEKSK